MSKDSPYKMFLNHAIIKMIEDGRLHHLNKIWIDKERKCTKKSEVPLGLEKTISIFFIVFGGVAVGMVTIAIEMWFGYVKFEKPKDPERIEVEANGNSKKKLVSDRLCKCDFVHQFLKSNQRRRSW